MFDFLKDETTSAIDFCKSIATMKAKATAFDFYSQLFEVENIPDETAKGSFNMIITFKHGIYFRVKDKIKDARIEIQQIEDILK